MATAWFGDLVWRGTPALPRRGERRVRQRQGSMRRCPVNPRSWLSMPATLTPDPPVNAPVGSKPSQGFPVMPEPRAVGYHLGASRSEPPTVRSQPFPVFEDSRPQRLRFLLVFNLIGAASGAGFVRFRRVLSAQGCTPRPAHQRNGPNCGQDPSSNSIDHVLLLVGEKSVTRKSCAPARRGTLERLGPRRLPARPSTARRRAGMTRAR